MSKRICVLGGAGFLGSHVADTLTDRGFKVRIFDNRQSSWIKNGQEMILGNLLDPRSVKDAISGCQYVYNFAGLSDLNEAKLKPVDTINMNILGNVYALEAAKKNNVERFIYASTVYVFGETGGFYRCSKLAAESYVESYQSQYGLNYTILRYGSLYGPRSDEKNGLFRILKGALVNKVIEYHGSPDTIREYIHVLDAATCSADILDQNFINQSITITGRQQIKVSDMLEILHEMLGSDYSIKFIDGHYEGHYVRTAYTFKSRIERTYSNKLHVDFGQGISSLLSEIEQLLK
jgi:UDP-glucose 4-epimerase